jgi:hypothetical protein
LLRGRGGGLGVRVVSAEKMRERLEQKRAASGLERAETEDWFLFLGERKEDARLLRKRASEGVVGGRPPEPPLRPTS